MTSWPFASACWFHPNLPITLKLVSLAKIHEPFFPFSTFYVMIHETRTTMLNDVNPICQPRKKKINTLKSNMSCLFSSSIYIIQTSKWESVNKWRYPFYSSFCTLKPMNKNPFLNTIKSLLLYLDITIQYTTSLTYLRTRLALPYCTTEQSETFTSLYDMQDFIVSCTHNFSSTCGHDDAESSFLMRFNLQILQLP